jgi:hypothetical protein
MKTILFKPFDRWSENILLTVGIGAAIVGTFLSYLFNGRFDGALDMHFGQDTTITKVACDLLIDFLSLLLFLYPAAILINRKTRIVDILSAVLISKVPMYALVVFNAGNVLLTEGDRIAAQAMAHEQPTFDPLGITLMIVFALVTLLFIVWSIALLFNGYKTACNAKGGKPIILFIAALLLAEIVSKILIAQFN